MLNKVRPRIFTIRVGSSHDVAENLMQYWANVNNGYYDNTLTSTQMDRAFDRAKTMLRQPAAYTLEAAMQHLQTFHPGEIRTAVMHHKAATRFEADYYAGKIIKWRWLVYPWAVNEDVSAFLKRLTPAPGSLKDAQELLVQQFNIKISKYT